MSQAELRVLVIDDDEDMRVTLMDFISRMGVKVRTAGDVAEAQRMLQTDATPFDLVLADLKLPGGTGLDILRAAHNRSRATLVTIITGYASLETAIEAIKLGAYDYITKPFSLEEIGVQVRNMIERVTLAKENARLSIRLQEVYGQLHHVQFKQAESSRFREDIRKELQEVNRKLDQLLAAHGSSNTERAPVLRADKSAIADLFRELEKLEHLKGSSSTTLLELEGKKRHLIEELVEKL